MFYEILEHLCYNAHIRPATLANKLGISTSMVARWKKGESLPNSDNLLKIANFFEVSVDYLLGRTSVPELPCADSHGAADQMLEQFQNLPIDVQRVVSMILQSFSGSSYTL